MTAKWGGAALLLAALLTLGVPAAFARGGRGGEGGHGFGGGHAFNGGGRAYGGGGRAYSSHGYDRGRGSEGSGFRGGRRDWDDHFRGYYRGGYYGGGYYGGGYYGGGYYGDGAPYAYGPSCGYYDAWGYWHADPNCYAPYGYGY